LKPKFETPNSRLPSQRAIINIKLEFLSSTFDAHVDEMKWTLLYQFFFEMGKNGYNRIIPILKGIFSLNENEWLLMFSKENSIVL